MNLGLNPTQRSRLHLAFLRATDACPSATSAHDVMAHAWAEMLAFHPNKIARVAVMVDKVSALAGGRRRVSIECEQLIAAMNGDAVAARLVAGTCGLVFNHDDAVDHDYFHTFGCDSDTISSDTVIDLAK